MDHSIESSFSEILRGSYLTKAFSVMSYSTTPLCETNHSYKDPKVNFEMPPTVHLAGQHIKQYDVHLRIHCAINYWNGTVNIKIHDLTIFVIGGKCHDSCFGLYQWRLKLDFNWDRFNPAFEIFFIPKNVEFKQEFNSPYLYISKYVYLFVFVCLFLLACCLT